MRMHDTIQPHASFLKQTRRKARRNFSGRRPSNRHQNPPLDSNSSAQISLTHARRLMHQTSSVGSALASRHAWVIRLPFSGVDSVFQSYERLSHQRPPVEKPFCFFDSTSAPRAPIAPIAALKSMKHFLPSAFSLIGEDACVR